jgi:hypothetical protein
MAAEHALKTLAQHRDAMTAHFATKLPCNLDSTKFDLCVRFYLKMFRLDVIDYMDTFVKKDFLTCKPYEYCHKRI